MSEPIRVRHGRKHCGRCNQLIFEYYASPDGHFGLVNFCGGAGGAGPGGKRIVRCGRCGARYRLLELLNAMGEPAERI